MYGSTLHGLVYNCHPRYETSSIRVSRVSTGWPKVKRDFDGFSEFQRTYLSHVTHFSHI